MAHSPKASPKYFSALRKSPVLLKTTALAIEVPESSTAPHTVSLRKNFIKATPYAARFPLIATPTSTRAKGGKSSTPHGKRSDNSFTFRSTGRQNSSPRAKQSLSQTPYKPRPSPNQPNTSIGTLGTSEKLLTPKASRPIGLKRPEVQGKLREVVTSSAPVETQGVDMYQEHLFQTFQALRVVKQFPKVSWEELKAHEVDLTRRPGYEGKKTLVLDLDETLVHCSDLDCCSAPDVHLPVQFPNGEEVLASLHIRPYVQECLQAANQDYEVIVFTASHQCYADVVLDYLDPDGSLVHHRLYRENCILVQGLYVKDLRILRNRDLERVVIVDNAVYSFGYQLDNGIPIISWVEDRQDRELLNLVDYMKLLAAAEDIRVLNRETFKLYSFYEDYLREIQAQTRKARRPRLRA